MDDERKQILQMVADGRITPEQANELFTVLDEQTAPQPTPEPTIAQAHAQRQQRHAEALSGARTDRHATLAKLLEARTMGVTPDYIHEMSQVGFTNLTLQELIEMRAMGVTYDYVHEMRTLGLDLGPRELIDFRAQGMTADFVHQMKASGLLDLAERELASMSAQDIAAALDEEEHLRHREDETSLAEER